MQLGESPIGEGSVPHVAFRDLTNECTERSLKTRVPIDGSDFDES
jgi:hypothetical protein